MGNRPSPHSPKMRLMRSREDSLMRDELAYEQAYTILNEEEDLSDLPPKTSSNDST